MGRARGTLQQDSRQRVRDHPGREAAETTGEDNLKTVRLVFGAYESARSGKVVEVLQ